MALRKTDIQKTKQKNFTGSQKLSPAFGWQWSLQSQTVILTYFFVLFFPAITHHVPLTVVHRAQNSNQ